MPKFRVRLKRVVFAEVVIEARTAREARQAVDQDPHEYFVTSDTIDTDTTTTVSVKLANVGN